MKYVSIKPCYIFKVFLMIIFRHMPSNEMGLRNLDLCVYEMKQ